MLQTLFKRYPVDIAFAPLLVPIMALHTLYNLLLQNISDKSELNLYFLMIEMYTIFDIFQDHNILSRLITVERDNICTFESYNFFHMLSKLTISLQVLKVAFKFYHFISLISLYEGYDYIHVYICLLYWFGSMYKVCV